MGTSATILSEKRTIQTFQIAKFRSNMNYQRLAKESSLHDLPKGSLRTANYVSSVYLGQTVHVCAELDLHWSIHKMNQGRFIYRKRPDSL